MSETEKAFLRLVRPCWRRLHLAAQRYAGSAGDARDLVQETLLRAWANYNPVEDRSYHEGWLFVILRRVSAEWGRRITLIYAIVSRLTKEVMSTLMRPS